MAVLVWAGITGGMAQTGTTPAKPFEPLSATVSPAALPPDLLPTPRAQVVADSLLARQDSAMYTRFKQRMYRHRLTRQFYDALFRDVYNSGRNSVEVSKIEENPFTPFAGKVIGQIYIRRLDVFGKSVYDTLRNSSNWAEKFANRLHVNTQEGIIKRSYLLFKQGDDIDPNVLRDNERLLRNAGIFHDARILVVPRANSRQFVDVYVITQDIWSLLPDGGVGGPTNFNLGFDQRNFRGFGHRLYSNVAWNGQEQGQKFEYRGRYTIPYISKTFVSAEANVQFLRDYKQLSVRAYRPFLTPDTKYAGSVELATIWLRNRLIDRIDSVQVFPLNYNYSDVWLGRSLRLFGGRELPLGRARVVLAVRRTSFQYLRRPNVRPDTNQLYQNTRTVLASVGFSQRRYVRDVLIYGFGRTEDVPVGMLLSVTGGLDQGELGERVYLGFNVARGQYFQNLGYVYGAVSVGSYSAVDQFRQKTFALTTNYFSPLHQTRWGNMRHFLNLGLTIGSDRFTNQYITLSGINGVGVSSDALRGSKRLTLSYENILFSRLNLAGFRIAIISFMNLGVISFPERALLGGPIYQGYGLGFRIRNENLTFNSFQIRLAYYPNIPDNPAALRFAVDGVPVSRFRDFDILAPATVLYE
jgi:hypothetical protein